jgi:hypothetical protein
MKTDPVHSMYEYAYISIRKHWSSTVLIMTSLLLHILFSWTFYSTEMKANLEFPISRILLLILCQYTDILQPNQMSFNTSSSLLIFTVWKNANEKKSGLL